MLLPIEEYLKSSGVYQKSLKELIAFKDRIYKNIKHYEDNKYTERMLELEVFMNPKPSVHYWWYCNCLIDVCSIIIVREDCDDKLRDVCMQDIDNAHIKIRKGLYENEKGFFERYRKLKGSIWKER